MSGLGGQPEEQVPGYALDLGAVAYRPEYPMYRYEKRQLANWPVRVGSTLIDSAVVGWPVWVPYTTMTGHHRSEMIRYGIPLQIALALLLTALEGRTGRSPGKAVLRLRLVDEGSGQPLGFWRAFGRRVAHVLDALSCYLGFLWPLWDRQRQTFADKVAKAVVVAEEHRL